MTTRVRLAAADAIGDDEIVRVGDSVDEQAVIAITGRPGPLALARSGGELFCIDDNCSHQEASLADGWVEDGCVECPLHESRFDLRTGRPDVPPAKQPIGVHRIEVVDGDVYLVAGAG